MGLWVVLIGSVVIGKGGSAALEVVGVILTHIHAYTYNKSSDGDDAAVLGEAVPGLDMDRLYAQALTALHLPPPPQEEQQEAAAPVVDDGGGQQRRNGTAPLGCAVRFEAAARGVGPYIRVRVRVCVCVFGNARGKGQCIDDDAAPRLLISIYTQPTHARDRRCGGRGWPSGGCCGRRTRRRCSASGRRRRSWTGTVCLRVGLKALSFLAHITRIPIPTYDTHTPTQAARHAGHGGR